MIQTLSCSMMNLFVCSFVHGSCVLSCCILSRVFTVFSTSKDHGQVLSQQHSPSYYYLDPTPEISSLYLVGRVEKPWLDAFWSMSIKFR
jgi:hypothetical protein